MYIKGRLRYIKEVNSPSPYDSGNNISDIDILNLGSDELSNVSIDVFEEIRYKVLQVVYGYGISLIITGQGGLGKSYEVEQALEESNKKYKFISGGITTAGLFELLFTSNDQLLVFDDCDSVFDNQDSVNILKSALDSKKKRIVSREIKTHFDTEGMTQNDIMSNYKGDPSIADNKNLVDPKNKGKLPKNFQYNGRVIFISNLKIDKIDPVLITRSSAHIDVDLTHDKIIERMKKVIRKIRPGVPYEKKEKVLRLMDYFSMNYKTKHPLSIRGLGNAIDTMVANSMTKSINGKNIPMWQILLKQDMLGDKAERREG